MRRSVGWLVGRLVSWSVGRSVDPENLENEDQKKKFFLNARLCKVFVASSIVGRSVGRSVGRLVGWLVDLPGMHQVQDTHLQGIIW